MKKQSRPIKLFGTGANRTGTTSLTQSLSLLGFPCKQYALELHHNIHHEIINRFDGFTDFPVLLHYKELDAAFPGSKFIHTVRDEASWLKSMEWLFTVGAVKFKWKRHSVFDRMHNEFYGTVKFEPNRFLQRYREHNAEVTAYFRGRPNDFLSINITAGDGFEQICPFLGVPIPDQPFPHDNRSEVLARVYARKAWRWIKGSI